MTNATEATYRCASAQYDEDGNTYTLAEFVDMVWASFGEDITEDDALELRDIDGQLVLVAQ